MKHCVAHYNDDFTEVLSSASEEVLEENCGRRKPVISHAGRAQRLAGDISLKNPEAREVCVTRATRSPGQEVPWVVSDVRSLSSKQLPDNNRDRSGNPVNENIASQCRIEHNNKKFKQLKNPACGPRPDTAR